MTTPIKGFLILLCIEKRDWADRGRKEVMSPVQVDQFNKVITDCDTALQELIKL